MSFSKDVNPTSKKKKFTVVAQQIKSRDLMRAHNYNITKDMHMSTCVSLNT